jgi:uncharacterized protein YbjT (DUF2867 family)
MTGKDWIVVIGATGLQGGAVARALVANGKFDVCGVVRNTNSDEAMELTKLGVELIPADLDDLDSLKLAFKGAYGAFFVTDYWEHLSPDKEIQQIKNLAEAGKSAGLRLVVNSALEDTRNIIKPGSMRKTRLDYYVPHFDAKGSCMEYVESHVPTIHLLTSGYYENFLNAGMRPELDNKGRLSISLPLAQAKCCLVAVEDIGKFAAKLFERPDLIGQKLGIASQILNMDQVVNAFAKVFGKMFVYHDIELEKLALCDFPGADDLANMYQFLRDYSDICIQHRDMDTTKKILSDPKPLTTWLSEHKSEFHFEEKERVTD